MQSRFECGVGGAGGSLVVETITERRVQSNACYLRVNIVGNLFDIFEDERAADGRRARTGFPEKFCVWEKFTTHEKMMKIEQPCYTLD